MSEKLGPLPVNARAYSSGEVLVKLALPKASLTSQEMAAVTGRALGAMQATGVRFQVRRPLLEGRWLQVRLEGHSVAEAMQRLAPVAELERIECNAVHRLRYLPSDARFAELWGLRNSQEGIDIGATSAWDLSRGSAVVVGIIDSGLDLTHPDLVSTRWKNPREVPGDRIDNDGNGYVDDVDGWDTSNDTNDPRPWPIPSPGGGYSAGQDHGTHVAGTVGAAANTQGIIGVAFGAQVMPVQVFDQPTYSQTEERWVMGSTDANIAAGITYAVKSGARVLNLSLGAEEDDSVGQVVSDAVDFAASRQVVVVAAAGNEGLDVDGRSRFPAGLTQDNVVIVAAHDRTGALADFSNKGAREVDIVAPGVDILSCYPGSNYRLKDGTSMASPHVAGVAALILSREPSLSPASVRQRLLDTATPDSRFIGRCVSGGRLNAARALTPGPGPSPTSSPSPSPPPGSTTVQLKTGWNGVGFAVPRVTSLTGAGGVVMASFDGRTYQTASLSLDNLNTGDGARRGFWLYTASATSFTYAGGDDGQGSFVKLGTGWNLVSFAHPGPIAGTGLSAVRDAQTVPLATVVLPQFYEIDANNQSVVRDVLAGGSITPGKAYWVFATAICRLTWGGAVPPPDALTLTAPVALLTAGRSTQLQVVNAVGADVTNSASYSVSHPLVARVSATGLLSALSSGTCTVTARLGTAVSNPVIVTVVDPPPPADSSAFGWGTKALERGR